jgi:hypothetical protein
MDKGTNQMYKIMYNVKRTRVNTDYLDIEKKDQQVLEMTILGLVTYMNELNLSKNKDVRDFMNWFHKSSKRYHYNNHLKRNNSPQSVLSGVLNNLYFGYQYNFTLPQLEMLQDIINTCIDIIQELEGLHKIKLQANPAYTKIWIQENMWEVTP